MSEYTPTTETIREHYRELSDTVLPGSGQGNVAVFDRWLEEVKREAFNYGHEEGYYDALAAEDW